MHNGDKPLRLQEVQVKIACDGTGDGKHKPVTVTAICPDHCYDSDYSSAAGKAQTYLTIPTTASAANPVSRLLCMTLCVLHRRGGMLLLVKSIPDHPRHRVHDAL